MIVPSETYLLSVGAISALAAFSTVAIVFLIVWKRRESSQKHIPTFLPPIIGVSNIPKEQTYIVPREWKPSSGGVYAPLSIPIHEERKGSRASWSPVSLMRALPPQQHQHQPSA